MIIAGHLKSSFIDYPDKISSVFFTSGCNFRCPYCHNAELILSSADSAELTYEDIGAFLNQKKKYLDGLVISGGEPTIHQDLGDFIRFLKAWDLPIKLDTNGTNPLMLEELLAEGLLDYVAMDLKAPAAKYGQVAKASLCLEDILASRKLLMASNIDYEFRSTIVSELHTKEDVVAMAQEIKGAKRYILQSFRDNEGVLEGLGKFNAYPPEIMAEWLEEIRPLFDEVHLR